MFVCLAFSELILAELGPKSSDRRSLPILPDVEKHLIRAHQVGHTKEVASEVIVLGIPKIEGEDFLGLVVTEESQNPKSFENAHCEPPMTLF